MKSNYTFFFLSHTHVYDIQAFGGKDWKQTASTLSAATKSNEAIDVIKRENTIRLRKKKSVANIMNQNSSTSTGSSHVLSDILPKDAKTRCVHTKKKFLILCVCVLPSTL